MNWHWQNLKKEDRERCLAHGRAWLRGEHPRAARAEWFLGWRTGLGFSIEWGGWNDDSLCVGFFLPFAALWLGWSGAGRLARFLNGCCHREIEVKWWDLTLWWNFAMNPHEWNSRDPKWRKGSFHLLPFLLGRWEGHSVDAGTVPVQIPMPEGVYHGTATTQRWTRGYRRWFKTETTEVWLDIPHGIPHAGKGENSWDCGDDGLFGIGGNSVEDAVGRAVASVMTSRRRHGDASPEAVQRALAQ